jgi:hypothetical protein
MERLVNSYIRAGPLKSFPLMESQYAYQRGRFTEAALHDLVQKIEGCLNQKEFALDVFLDIDGTFDNVFFGSMDAVSGEHGVVLTLQCQGARKSGMPTGRSTVPSVVEHGSGLSSS